MALKGTTRIELTDVNTGKKEVIEKTNMVTNAINDILSYNPFGMRFRNYKNTLNSYDIEEDFTSFQAKFLPVAKKLLGGILLFGDALEENPDKYYAEMENPIIGYSSIDVNTTADARRGSMNQTESGYLEDGSGYRFVFDFSTSQGNGTISSLGLTSKWGGVGASGSNYDNGFTNCLCVDEHISADTNPPQLSAASRALDSIVSIDPEKNIAYSAYVSGANSITITRYVMPFDAIGLRQNYNPILTKIDSQVINTAKFAATYSTSNYFYGTLIDGGDGYIWGFQHSGNAAGNSSGNATVLWVKINKEDFTFEEGTWTINAQLMAFGRYYTPYTYSDVAKFINRAVIHNGVLYAMKYAVDNNDNINGSSKGIYAISLNNVTDVKLYEGGGSIYHSTAATLSYCRTGTAVNVVGNTVVYHDAVFNGTDFIRKSTKPFHTQMPTWDRCLAKSAKPGLRYGPYMLGISVYSSSNTAGRVEIRVYLPTYYLATINNLENPVQKTADKTMKITYIIREEPENTEL